MGVGGGIALKENDHSITIDPLMAAAAKRAAASTLTQVSQNGIMQPYPETGAYFLEIPTDSAGATVTAIALPFTDSPAIYVNQMIPLNYDFTKDAQVTFTFNIPMAIQLANVGKTATFSLGVELPTGKLQTKSLTLTLSNIESSINTISATYKVLGRSTRRIRQGSSPLVKFVFTRINTEINNIEGDLNLLGFQVEYKQN